MSQNKKIVLRDTQFEAKSTGHGGNRRTKQIEEILEKEGINLVDLQNLRKTSIKNKLLVILQQIYYLVVFLPKFYPNFKNLIKSIIKNEKSDIIFKSQANYSKLMLWEDSLNFITLYKAKKMGIKIVSIPQNFDSFAVEEQKPNTHNFPKNFNLLGKEIMCLFQSDAVFCISREEQWFLRACGLDSQYLPYYPPDSILHKLLEIRSKRIRNQEDNNYKQKKWLVLGTYHNAATKSGMIELVNWLNEINEVLSIEISIAGYGTEKIEKEIELTSHFNLLGSLSEEDLYQIIIDCKGIIVHQRYGLGALTKIPEMLIAGIPIIANTIASRSYYDYEGLYTYEDKFQLANFLQNNFPIPPIVSRPTNHENYFIEYVHSLLS